MTKFGHLESYMIRNKVLEWQSPGEREKKEKKNWEEKRLFFEPKTTQRFFTSEDLKGLEANRWRFFFMEGELAEVDMQNMSL